MKIKNNKTYQQYTDKKNAIKDMIIVAKGLRKIPFLYSRIAVATYLANPRLREFMKNNAVYLPWSADRYTNLTNTGQ